MNKKTKMPEVFYSNGIRFTLDPNMKELPFSGSLARKVEEAIETWSKVKDVNDVIRRPAKDSSPE